MHVFCLALMLYCVVICQCQVFGTITSVSLLTVVVLACCRGERGHYVPSVRLAEAAESYGG